MPLSTLHSNYHHEWLIRLPRVAPNSWTNAAWHLTMMINGGQRRICECRPGWVRLGHLSGRPSASALDQLKDADLKALAMHNNIPRQGHWMAADLRSAVSELLERHPSVQLRIPRPAHRQMDDAPEGTKPSSPRRAAGRRHRTHSGSQTDCDSPVSGANVSPRAFPWTDDEPLLPSRGQRERHQEHQQSRSAYVRQARAAQKTRSSRATS